MFVFVFLYLRERASFVPVALEKTFTSYISGMAPVPQKWIMSETIFATDVVAIVDARSWNFKNNSALSYSTYSANFNCLPRKRYRAVDRWIVVGELLSNGALHATDDRNFGLTNERTDRLERKNV